MSNYSNLTSNINSVILSVVEELGDDMFPICGNTNIDSINGVNNLTIVAYSNGDNGYNHYALFEDGNVYLVKNNDNTVWRIQDKVAEFEIKEVLDYRTYENVEKVVFGLIDNIRVVELD